MGKLFSSEKEDLAPKPKPSFHIRPMAQSDAPSMRELNTEFPQLSLRSTRPEVAPLSTFKAMIPVSDIENCVFLSAVTTIPKKRPWR